MKTCIKCNERKELNEYFKEPRNKDGLRSSCKECRKKYARGAITKNSNLMRSYGINLSKYNEMVLSQNGCCFICKRHRKEMSQDLHVDHCHKSKKVMGLLCFNCNQGLGNFKDSIGLLLQASDYLKQFSSEQGK